MDCGTEPTPPAPRSFEKSPSRKVANRFVPATADSAEFPMERHIACRTPLG